MKYSIEYTELIDKKKLKKFPKEDRAHIFNAIERKLTGKPDLFGKPLRRTLLGYRRLRVGDYRIIFKIHKNTVLVFAIDNRSVAYKNLEKRLKN